MFPVDRVLKKQPSRFASRPISAAFPQPSMASFLLPSSLFLLLLLSLLFSTPAALRLPKKPPPPSSGGAPVPCSKTYVESLKFNPNSQITLLGKMADEEHAKEWKQVNGELMPPKDTLVFREVMSVDQITCADNNRVMSFEFRIQVRMGFEDGVLYASLDVVYPSGAFRLGLWSFVTV
ncbi:hypothetical protein AXF42_Ash014287 [Apostasia shenzhenica]|uniref:Uncharacterized protein n=1 Tax=Apostasia shenzhenica TaxID=1088818 RepID=A0A2I0B0Q1_9ASPA|nr:hypothetical protein AXF42_Ash014287 [Apostasia shenzhenica]